MKQKERKQRFRRGWIRFRYLFPLAAILLTAATLFIPCLRFTTADTGTGEAISVAELMKNAWDQVRTYLFATAEQQEATVAFSQSVLITLIVLWLLFLLGTAATVWVTIGAFRHFSDPEGSGTDRILFRTVFPNRIVACVYRGLTLPLLLFPRILVLFYENILHYTVLLNLTFPEPIIFGGILFLAELVLVAVFSPMETVANMNPYRKRRRQIGIEEDEAEAEETPVFQTEAEQKQYELLERSRAEQAERIRKLLRNEENK